MSVAESASRTLSWSKLLARSKASLNTKTAAEAWAVWYGMPVLYSGYATLNSLSYLWASPKSGSLLGRFVNHCVGQRIPLADFGNFT